MVVVITHSFLTLIVKFGNLIKAFSGSTRISWLASIKASEEDGQDSNIFLDKPEADTIAIQTNTTTIYIVIIFKK